MAFDSIVLSQKFWVKSFDSKVSSRQGWRRCKSAKAERESSSLWCGIFLGYVMINDCFEFRNCCLATWNHFWKCFFFFDLFRKAFFKNQAFVAQKFGLSCGICYSTGTQLNWLDLVCGQAIQIIPFRTPVDFVVNQWIDSLSVDWFSRPSLSCNVSLPVSCNVSLPVIGKWMAWKLVQELKPSFM